MKIGIIGAGDIGQRLAKHFLNTGSEVMICNSRGPETLKETVASLGRAASAGTLQEVAAQEIVVLAIWWDTIPKVMEQVSDWNGRILIDATNMLTVTERGPRPVKLENMTGSEYVASLAKNARVVKAFNHLFGQYIDGKVDGGRRVLFYAGDDANAKQTLHIHLPRFEIFGQQALFADMARSEIDKLQGTEKLYHYDLRHGDDDSIPLTVERQVIVNRFATIFTAEPLLTEGEDHRAIREDDWTFLSDLDDMTPDQFYDEMQREKESSVEREATGLGGAAMQPGERLARKDTIQGRKEKHSSRPDGKRRSVREAIRDNQKSAKGDVKKGQSKDGKEHTV